MTPPRRFWQVSASEARAHAIILAIVLWGLAVVVLAWPGPRDPFGTLKGSDFVHFYTLGHVAAARDPTVLYDGPAQAELQRALVPASAGDYFAPVYPPQLSLVFAPLHLLPYFAAYGLVAAIIVVAYGWSLSRAWRLSPDAVPVRLMGWAAAAFPPFWYLVLHGQTTFVYLIAFVAAARWIAADRPVMAGAALGLLALKPPLAPIVTLVMIAAGEGRILGGMALSVVGQVVAAAAVFGPWVWTDYASTLGSVASVLAKIEPKPYQLHSIRVLTDLLPSPIDELVWIAAVVAIAWVAFRVWRSSAPLAHRMAILIVASVLASAHLTVYDVTLLAPALIWLAPALRRVFGSRMSALVYALYVFLLLPSALFAHIQFSVVLIVLVFILCSRRSASGID